MSHLTDRELAELLAAIAGDEPLSRAELRGLALEVMRLRRTLAECIYTTYIHPMTTRFEWDDAKASANLVKHGIDFADAVLAFADPQFVSVETTKPEHGERRWLGFGRVDGRLLAVAYTIRSDATRIISARKAIRREQRKYGAQ
ncbi:hypothetical protein J421_4646 (plasmid) [Gemmatirosa kalamazoonensis]|uniref:BrnT family toxin n=1 Tax=Gemmatirosa kalamazoonensis TaxID=861299 RepID=W0RR99_9BACT|nr:BrnT family toxin [Gemmatirosa kalamazoonensis]AHG92113.1 hypothetical protein J421_4578 [Gemmatirosa kalamazoonensis]AHG92181.1 hypothetical protein J421_4646 [Gemmatirosa kalamazoonensis]